MSKFYPTPKVCSESIIKSSVLFLLLLSSFLGLAQTAVIGTGTTVPSNTLYGPVYRFSATSTTTSARSNMLFTAAEMAAAGIPAGAQITQVEFFKANASTFLIPVEYVMLMANTSNTSLNTGQAWTAIQASHTVVYTNNSFNLPATTGWVPWVLSTPFTYTGGALEIATQHNMTGGGAGANGNITWQYSGTEGSTASLIVGATGTGTTYPATLTGTVADYKNRPNLRITYTASGCTSPPTAGTAQSSATGVSCSGAPVTLSLSGNSAGLGQTYQWQSSTSSTGPFTSFGSSTTSPGTIINPTSTAWYRAAVTCSGVTTFSTPVQVSIAPLFSGTYTIGGPAGPNNFPTFAAAVTAMSCGINGPVVFNVTAGTYNEQVTIPSINGTSATNTITFNGNAANLTFHSSTSAARHVIKLDGTDYVRINNLVINSSTGTYGWGIHLANSADSNIINGNTININSTGTVASDFVGIVMTGSSTSVTSSGDNGDGNMFSNNTINGGYYNAVLYGSSAAGGLNMNNSFVGNILRDNYAYGVYAAYQQNVLISKNDISRPTRTAATTGGGVLLTTGNISALVEKNRIHNFFDAIPASTSIFYGVNVAADGTAGAPNLITNNLVYNINHNGTAYGIYNITGPFMKAYHNTIVFNSTVSTAGTTYGLYQSGTASGIEFRNNIVYVTRSGTGIKRAVYFNTTTSAITSDNNVFWFAPPAGTDNNFGQYGTTVFATFANWQTAASGIFDGASLYADPLFASPGTGNFFPTNALVNNVGGTVGVTQDILDSTRDVSTPTPGAYEVPAPTSVDVSATNLVLPIQKTCYTSTETVTIRIRNNSSATHNFAVSPVTVKASVSGPNPTVFAPVIVSTGTLVPNGTLDVLVSNNYNMSLPGVYQFSANTTTAGDVLTSNDTMAVQSITAVPLEAGTASSSPSQYCFIGGIPKLSTAGSSGGSLQWYQSSSATGPWTAVGTDSTGYTPSSAITTTMYYRVIASCSGNSDTSNVVVVPINNPQLLSTIPGSRCGPGSVTLGATGSTGSTFNWYASATGGAPLFTGANFSTPVINATTTYYVAASSGGSNESLGKPAPTTTLNTTGNAWGLVFNVTNQAIQLNSVTVYSVGATAGSISVLLTNSAGTVLATAGPFAYPAGSTANPVPVVLPVNFTVPVGTGYRLLSSAMSGGALIRETSGNTFPYTSPSGNVSITSGFIGGTSNTYYWFYNWNVSTGCESSRQAVTATLTAAPAFNVTDSVTICNNAIQALTVNTGATAFTSYIWSPNAGLFTDAAATIPYTGGSATTVYVRNATGGTYWYYINASNSTTNCTGIDSVKVVVLPANITVQATPSQICSQGSTFLSIAPATGYQNATFQWQISTNGGSTYTNITGATGSTYATPVISQTTMYRVQIRNSAGVICQEPSVTVTVNTPQVLTSAGATNCGPGSLTLNATGSAGTSLNWYASPQGGAPVGSGTSFTTPNLTATTTYYVSATSGGTIQSTGAINPAQIGTASSQTILNSGIRFDALNLTGVQIQSVDIFPTASVGTGFQIAIVQGPLTSGPVVNGSNGQPLIYNGVTTVQGSAVNPIAQTIPVNFQVPAGFDYIMVFKTTNPAALRNNPATTASFPYSLTGQISLTGSTTANTYQFFYNWRIGSGCESPRTAVTATISANTAITTQPQGQGVCSGATLQLTVAGTGAGVTYQWFKDGQPIANSNNDTLIIPNAQPANAGVYTVTLTGSCGTVTSQPVNVAVSGQNTWLGGVSSDWHTAANWCGSIPTQTSDIIIPSGTPNQPVVSSIADVRNLTVQPGASLTINANGFLNVWGNYANTGTLNAQNGFLGFKGTTLKTATGLNAGTVVINGPGGVSLQGDWTVSTLILEDGNISLNASSLALTASAIGSPASHIVTNGAGSVRALNVNSGRTIGVGADANSYNPVIITNGQGRDYTVRVVTGISPSITNTARAINRTWTVLPSSAVTIPVELTFQWADAHGNASVTAGGAMEVGVNSNAPGGIWNILSPPGGLTPAGGTTNRSVTVLTSTFGNFVVSSPGGFTYPLSAPNVDLEVSSVQLLPNLVQSRTTMRMEMQRASRVQWTIVDASGRVVRQWAQTYSAGRTDEGLNLINLSKGTYFLMGHTQKGKTSPVRMVKE